MSGYVTICELVPSGEDLPSTELEEFVYVLKDSILEMFVELSKIPEAKPSTTVGSFIA